MVRQMLIPTGMFVLMTLFSVGCYTKIGSPPPDVQGDSIQAEEEVRTYQEGYRPTRYRDAPYYGSYYYSPYSSPYYYDYFYSDWYYPYYRGYYPYYDHHYYSDYGYRYSTPAVKKRSTTRGRLHRRTEER